MLAVTNDSNTAEAKIPFKDQKAPFVHDYAREAAKKTGVPHTVWRENGRDKDWKKVKTYRPDGSS